MVLFEAFLGLSMARDWAGYNEALVRRGEVLLDLSLLQGWSSELEGMNLGKEGGRYRYPSSFIKLLGFIHLYFRLPYRQLEGFIRALVKFEPRLEAPDYTTMCRRVNRLSLGLEPSLDPRQEVTIAVDASGIQVSNRGEWIRRRWKVRQGYLKIHLAVEVKTGQILALEVTDEGVGDGKMLKPLVKAAQKKAKVKRVLADGAYDSKENFRFLDQEDIDPAIRVRRSSSGRAGGCMPRKLVAQEFLKDPEGWRRRVGYGLRWRVETALSCLKRLFGDHVAARHFPNMIKEMLLKAALYNLFTGLNPAI